MYVIKYGDSYYSRKFSPYAGNNATLSRATRWATREGAERNVQRLRDYRTSVWGSTSVPSLIEVIELPE